MRGKARNHLPSLFGKYEDHVSQFCRLTLVGKNMKKNAISYAILLRFTSNRVSNLLPSITLAQREALLYRNVTEKRFQGIYFQNLIPDVCFHYKILFLQGSFLYLFYITEPFLVLK